ncbi:MAG: hypothetical protein LBB81_04785 [Treponema sp.]|jgi:hypothetical protein|nr:hypothetical protein [Treponema sp.]
MAPASIINFLSNEDTSLLAAGCLRLQGVWKYIREKEMRVRQYRKRLWFDKYVLNGFLPY